MRFFQLDDYVVDEELSRSYRGKVLFGPFIAVQPHELEAIESEIGGRLPEGYRDFIQLANGGALEYDIRVPPGDTGQVVGFTELYSLGKDRRGEYGHSTLLGAYRKRNDQWLAERVPMRWLLPIARTGGNDTLFLDLNPQHPGRVVAFVHGRPQWTGRNQHPVLATVADSFEAYLDALFIDDDTAQLNWEDVEHVEPDEPWRRVVEHWLDDGLPGWRTRPWGPGR